mmetsp:Transcript_13116/g.33067  ORF Transcript_13116/g.33067 Transcript_13116/m.33067 type:complete len:653 (-) Transcript_13116:153-2111(-)
MPSWNDDIDDEFEDEDDIEIVSLLDHDVPKDDRQKDDSHADHETTGTTDHTLGQSSNNERSKKKNSNVQLFGLCFVIGFVLLVATILLSQSSNPSDTKTPSETAKYDNIDGNKINSSVTKNKDEKSESKIIGTAEAENATSAAIENSNEQESDELPSTKNSNNEGNASSSPKEIEDQDGNEDDGNWFELQTGNSRIDRAYRLAMDELQQNIEHDEDGSPYFVTGAGGERSWTRNTAYAIELGAGLVQPYVSRLSLKECSEVATMSVGEKQMMGTVWYQDTSDDFGGWPNLSDAIVGARGAWHLYLYTGDSTFLEWAYETTLNSLLRAEIDVLRHSNGGNFKHQLFGGSSAFIQSNSGYPKKYENNGELVGKTKALSTNILYYSGYHFAYKMGTILMENNQIVNSLKDRSKFLKNTIRERLWMEDKGLYAYFEDENKKLVPQIEGLGMALAMLTDEFEVDHRINMMFDNFHRTEFGIPSLWPHFGYEKDDSIDDKTGRIWPLVSGYFAIAAARHGKSDIFAEEMASLIDLSEQENTFAEFHELDKSSEKDRRRQLWSDAGYLGMVYKGLFGMEFQKGAIEFSPTKVEGKDGILKTNETISLLNVKYRKAILDVYITGSGSNVTSFKLNGKVQARPTMDGWVTGRQLIEIEVAP